LAVDEQLVRRGLHGQTLGAGDRWVAVQADVDGGDAGGDELANGLSDGGEVLAGCGGEVAQARRCAKRRAWKAARRSWSMQISAECGNGHLHLETLRAALDRHVAAQKVGTDRHNHTVNAA
jgi:hypothetical protein